jgi:hypothetical protein
MMEQVPTETSVTMFPETVQTGVVVEVKLTVRPEEAVAVTLKLPVLRPTLGSVPKEIVWDPWAMPIEKLWDAEMFPALSVTVTPKLNGLPVTDDGVPDIWPVEGFSCRVPGGKAPLLTAQLLYGGTPPVAFNVAE